MIISGKDDCRSRWTATWLSARSMKKYDSPTSFFHDLLSEKQRRKKNRPGKVESISWVKKRKADQLNENPEGGVGAKKVKLSEPEKAETKRTEFGLPKAFKRYKRKKKESFPSAGIVRFVRTPNGTVTCVMPIDKSKNHLATPGGTSVNLSPQGRHFIVVKTQKVLEVHEEEEPVVLSPTESINEVNAVVSTEGKNETLNPKKPDSVLSNRALSAQVAVNKNPTQLKATTPDYPRNRFSQRSNFDAAITTAAFQPMVSAIPPIPRNNFST
eukprot:1394187-Amorphochlora_amoeboformis.AAC.1